VPHAEPEIELLPDDAPLHLPRLSPRPWQEEALASLSAIRQGGYSRALVAVATGLGKTWLAAFDVVAVGRALGRLPRASRLSAEPAIPDSSRACSVCSARPPALP
jgi:hypothetical protein